MFGAGPLARLSAHWRT